MAKYKKFAEVVRFFKKEHPTPFPLSVRRVSLTNQEGMCIRFFDPDRFIIKISNKLSEQQCIDVFIHELAHALSWSHHLDNLEGEVLDEALHSEEWGVVYSKLYRKWTKFFCGKEWGKPDKPKDEKRNNNK